MKKYIYVLCILVLSACGGSSNIEDEVITPMSDGDVPMSDGDNDPPMSDEEDETTAPDPTTLIFPLDNTECSNDNLTFRWNVTSDPSGGEVSYRLHVATSSDFDTDLDIYATTDTEFNVDLPQNTVLYWMVEATNGTNSSFSETRNLFTQGEAVANTIPILEYLSPENNSIINGTSVSLQWQGTDEESANENLLYTLYLAEVGDNLDIFQENNDTELQIDLNSGIEYQWFVEVTDEHGATTIGQVFRFSIR